MSSNHKQSQKQSDSPVDVFPRFASVTGICFKFLLVHWIVSVFVIGQCLFYGLKYTVHQQQLPRFITWRLFFSDLTMIIFFHLVPSYVRLANGLQFNEGRVEVYHQGVWGPVCRVGWSQSDSSVACRELGFNESVSTGGNKVFVSI